MARPYFVGANATLRMMLTSGTEMPLTGPFWILFIRWVSIFGAVMLNTKKKSKLRGV